MLYPKFSQRYLAAIVCSLILLLAISTLVLAYSLYIRRSPLLVKHLENALPSGLLKNNHLFNAKIHGQMGLNGSTELNAFSFRKYPSNKGRAMSSPIEPNIPYWQGKNNLTETDLDESNYSDTIYIDDFERNKTNVWTSERPIAKISSENSPIRYAESHSQLNMLIPTFVSVDRPSSSEMIGSHRSLNLDSVYDRSHGSEESLAEDGDDGDDQSTYGSGSGDFDVTSFTGNEELAEYDVSASNLFAKDFKNDDRKLRTKSKMYDRSQSAQSEKRRNEAESRNKAFTIKDRNSNGIKYKRMRPGFPEGSSFTDKFAANFIEKLPKSEKRRMKNKLPTSLDTKDPLVKSVKEEHGFKQNYSYNKNKSNKNKNKDKNKAHISVPTTATATKSTTALAPEMASELTKRKLGSRLRLREDDINRSDEGGQFRKPLAGMSSEFDVKSESKQLNSSPTWADTRTRLFASRRALGNARKSEERSRQLLLCEEAGGGELCQMLFKGHTRK